MTRRIGCYWFGGMLGVNDLLLGVYKLRSAVFAGAWLMDGEVRGNARGRWMSRAFGILRLLELVEMR